MSLYKCQELKINDMVKLRVVNFFLRILSVNNGFHHQI